MQRLKFTHRRCYCALFTNDRLHVRLSSSMIASRLERWIAVYESTVGITVVKQAQNTVIEEESKFVSVQHERRARQESLSSIQNRLRMLNTELEKIPRTDDRYLKLLTEEHTIIKEEKSLSDEVQALETKERQQFSILSSALRDSHEKERTQAERTKYWSIAGSCIGALIGILGTSINNSRRMRQLKSLVVTSSQPTSAITDRLDGVASSLHLLEERLGETVYKCDVEGTDEPNILTAVDHSSSIDKLTERISYLETNLSIAVAGCAVASLASCIILLLR